MVKKKGKNKSALKGDYYKKVKFWVMTLIGAVAGTFAFGPIGFVIGTIGGIYVGKMAVEK